MKYKISLILFALYPFLSFADVDVSMGTDLRTGNTNVGQMMDDIETAFANVKTFTETNEDDIALKANLASPTFTGVPAAPTATTGTSTTQVASTAFVQQEIAAYQTFTDSITASATQTQGGGTAITATRNRITTSATNGDAVTLADDATYTVGEPIYVYNDDAAQTIQLFPASGDALGDADDDGDVDANDQDLSITLYPGQYAVLIPLGSNVYKVTYTQREKFAIQRTIMQPDDAFAESDDIVLYKFVEEVFPNGVTVESIHIDASASITSQAFILEHWDDAAGTTQATIDTVTLTAELSEEDDGTFDDATVPTDYLLILNGPATPEDVSYVSILVTGWID